MVSFELVSREVARLGGLDRFPRKPEPLRELALAYQRTYGTHPELTAAIDDVIRTTDVCPKPSHIYGQGEREQTSSGVGCSVCDGTSFIMRTDRRETLDSVRDVPMAYFCSCRPRSREGVDR